MKPVMVVILTFVLISLIILGTSGCTNRYILLVRPIPGEGGDIQVSPLPGADGKYNKGTRVTLEARPTTGYQFVRWSNDYSGTMPSTVVTVDMDKNIVAEFKKIDTKTPVEPSPASIPNPPLTPSLTTTPANTTIPTVVKPPSSFTSIPSPLTTTSPPVYSLTTSCIGSGSISPSAGSYKKGSQVILTASPGAQFERWSGTDDNYSNPTVVIMNSDRSVAAHFKTPPVTTVIPPTSTAVPPTKTVTPPTITVTPPTITVTPPTITVTPPTTTVIPPTVILTAPSISVKPPVVLSTSLSSAGSGTIYPSSGIYNVGSSVSLTASPASCYKFDSWSGSASGTSTTLNVVMNADKSIIANFSKIRYTLIASISQSASGNVSPSGGTYDCGEAVTLNATPASGYQFDHWSGTDNDFINPTTVNMNSNKNVVAFFQIAPSIPSPPSGSSVTESVSIKEQVTTTATGKGILSIVLRLADGKPMIGNYVYVYTQKKDIAGNWIFDTQVTYGYTDSTGRKSFDLVPGNYALQISGLGGYNWGNMVVEKGEVDVAVKTGQTMVKRVDIGRLAVELAYADGKPMIGNYVYVYTQKKDVAENWVIDTQVTYGYTDSTGRKSFDLVPGNYALKISGLGGYNWGNMVGDVGEVNVSVITSQTTIKRVNMGRLIVGITTSQGGAAKGVYVYVYTQKKDVADNWVFNSQITNGGTDNTGMVSFDLTPGQYAVQFRRPGDTADLILFNTSLEGGKITSVIK